VTTCTVSGKYEGFGETGYLYVQDKRVQMMKTRLPEILKKIY